jgi:hypothetical protein
MKMSIENIVNGDIESMIHVGSVLVNLGIAYVMMRIKMEVSEMKLWVFENFERRREPR